MELLKASVASLLPSKCRTWLGYFEKPALVRGAVVSGVFEFLLFGSLEFLQFRQHFLAQALHFANGNVGTQTAALLVIAAAEIFYPLSFVYIALAVEGFLRAVSGAIVGEAVPSLPAAMLARCWAWFSHPRHSPAQR